MITKELCKKFNNAMWKMGEHPAMPEIVFPFANNLWFSLQEVCKNGYSHWVTKDGIQIMYSPANYKKYKGKFDKELKEYKEDDISRSLVTIHIPYEEYYGYKWKFDHFEYWGECSFFVYQLKDYSFKKVHDIKNWGAYQGVNCSAPSFEELIVKTKNKFFKCFGSKLEEDFLTKEEKDNHKKERLFLMDRKSKDGKGYYMDRNPNYIEVSIGKINHRWLRWFVTTDYCKRNWKTEFDNLLKGFSNEDSETAKSEQR